MDCVYRAYTDYLGWLDEPVTPCDLLYWKTLKWWTHGSKPQYTFGGVAPWIINKLAGLHGMYAGVVNRVYTPLGYIDVAKKCYPAHYKRMRYIIARTDWHKVSNINVAPAIYLLLTGQHAVFSTQVPTCGVPITAIWLNRF